MKKYVNILVLCIVGLLITVSATAVVETRETIEQMNVDDPIVIIRNPEANTHTVAAKAERLSDVFKPIALPLADVPVASTEDDEIHPTITKGAGKYFAGYSNKISILEQYVYMITSEDGTTWTPLGFWNLEGISDYPSFDHWGGNTFYGTLSGEEGFQYLIEAPDIDDQEGFGLIYWDWSDDGWYDMKEMDMACHDSQNTWEYGFMSTVASTTYGEDQGWDGENMPHVFYRDPVEEGTGYISWNTYPGCAHSAICMDKTADMMYAVYDYYNGTTGSWNLLLWKRSFEDPSEGLSEFVEIQTSSNLQYPTIAADNDNIMIVCHSDENTNSDLICYHSNDGGENWETTYIANSQPNDEQYPDMVSIGGVSAGCVFTMNNGLFYISTEDGGATWTDPVKLNDGDSVVEEYRTASVCVGSTVWSDRRNGNPDIFYDVTGAFPEVSVKTISGGFGVSAEIENVGTADATNVQWSIDLEGGLVIVGSHADGTISTLAPGASQTVKIGLVLGFGGVTITASASGSTKTASGTVLGPFVIGVS